MDTIRRLILYNVWARRSKTFRLEARRVLKALARWMAKHWGWGYNYRDVYSCVPKQVEMGIREYLESLVDLLTLIPIPKFCNGLIGVSLTDSLTARIN